VLAIDTSQWIENWYLEPLQKLVHLRYLRLSGHAKLPKEIPGLKFLQTLDVDDEPLTSVSSLTQLLCHRIRGITWRVPDGIAKLTSLQEFEIVHRGEKEP